MVVIKSLEQAEVVVLKNSNNSGNSSLSGMDGIFLK